MESLLQFQKSLQQREKTLNEASSTINVVYFTFGSSDPTLKNMIEEKEAKIRDLHQKILEKGKALHLGCDSEIQDLKSQIKALQNKPVAEAILYTPSDSDLRAQELEKEVQQVKRKLSAVQYDLKWTDDDLKIKEDEHSNQKNNNVEMLKKFLEEKERLHRKVINLANKVKEEEKN